MKKMAFLFLTALMTISLNAQTTSLLHEESASSVGKNWITGEDITAKEHLFSGEIATFYYDFENNSAVLALNENGSSLPKRLISYDLQEMDVKFDRPLNPKNRRDSYFFISSGLLFENYKNKNYFVDINENGERTWKLKDVVLYADREKDLMIGLEVKSNNAVTAMYGAEISTGEMKWSFSMQEKEDLGEFYFLNDSIMLIAASGIYAVDIYSGLAWRYIANTSKVDGMFFAAVAVSALVGALSGVAYYPYYENVVVNGISSNMLIFDNKTYYASIDNLSCFAENGNPVWVALLDKKRSAASHIFIQDDVIYLLNRGALFQQDGASLPNAYLAAYDRRDGAALFQEVIPLDEKTRILDYKIYDDVLSLIAADQITLVSLKTGKILNSKGFDIEKRGKLRHFANDFVYEMDEEDIFNVHLGEESSYAVFTSNDDLYLFDKEVNIVKILKMENLCFYAFSIDDVDFFQKEKELLGVNEAGKIICSIQNISKSAYIIDGVIYDVKENKLLEIDLKQIIGQTSKQISEEVEN